MMVRLRSHHGIPGMALAAALAFAAHNVMTEKAFAASDENLMPYTMLRSMQFVQDSVVRGDHSASGMQRFMLETLDARFRNIETSAFQDPRNVDAALIYAMSGGNPETLEYLVARDVDGNFDSRVADLMRKYLSGKGALVAKSLASLVPEYRDTRIGPYLALVSGNVILTTDPSEALKFYDLARLLAPGTIVEEAALRRSVAISVEQGQVPRSLDYAKRYTRRFIYSPYASQFADLLVVLAVRNYGEVTDEDITETIEPMDDQRKREIYLRIARKAAIDGKNDLARLAAAHAQALSPEEDLPGQAPRAAAELYDGLARVMTSGVDDVRKAMETLPVEGLSERDRALRAAAEKIASEVLRQPERELLQAADKDLSSQEEAAMAEPEFKRVITTGRAKLDEIDGLLKQESATR